MPLQNRVTPTGEIVWAAARGGWMGNRGGRLHTASRELGRRRWTSKSWIICRLDFKGRRRQVMGDGYTELFFLDEATALAAGHRPCFECRRAAANAFRAGWARGNRTEPPRAAAMDTVLHGERCQVIGYEYRTEAALSTLPDGAFVALDGGSWLKWRGALRAWSPGGYGECRPLPETALPITPPSTLAAMRGGYLPEVHESANTIR